MRDWQALVRARLEAEGAVLDRETIDELAAHLTDVYRAAIAQGADPATADAEAEAELAGLGPLATGLDRRWRRARASTARPSARLTGLAGDLRQATRLLRRRPGLAALIVLMLSLGIGVATTVFGLYDAVLLTSMPYPEASRLVVLWEAERKNPESTYIVAAPVYEDWRQRNRTLASLGIWEFLTFNVSAAAEPDTVQGIRASASLFDTLGVSPAIGRTFTAAEDAAGARVAVISDAVWRAHFAADPLVAGRQIRLNDAAYDVIGVMPRSFAFPQRSNGIYVPMSFTERDRERDSHSFYVIGRLRDGVTVDQARQDFARIGDDLAREFPANAEETSRPTLLADFGMTTVRRMLAALAGASGLILLIACVNVANLLIARGLDRRREFGLRQALGAGRVRLARQLLIEGFALGVPAVAGGLLVAWLGSRAVGRLLGDDFLSFWFRGSATVTVDGAAFAFAVVAAIVTAFLFSFAPLAALRRSSWTSPAQDASRVASRPAFGLRRVLVAVEVGLAIVVLCGAGVLVKSVATLLRVSPGIDPDRVLTMQVSLPQEDTYGPAVRATFCEDITAATAGGPFAAVGAISHLPFSGANASRGLSIDGRAPDPGNPVSANYRLICPGYFRTLAIPLVRGRDALASDIEPVVVINRAMADRYWKDQDAVGQRIRLGRADGPPWMRIVGIAENVRHFGLDSEPVREIFVPYRQNAWPRMTVVAKAAGPMTPPVAAALKDLVRRTHPDVPATTVRTMTQVIDGSMSWRVSFLRLLLVFAALGLALSSAGVYGVLAYFVSQRSRELGIRVALGAVRPAIVLLVLRQSLLPVIAGVVLGVLASLWSNRLLTDLLFRTNPGDPLVLVTVASLVVLVGVAASWMPANRAARVNPTEVLRRD